MSNAQFDQRQALDLISQLSRHLATELDLHYDSLPGETFAEERALLIDARRFLVEHHEVPTDAIEHVLNKVSN